MTLEQAVRQALTERTSKAPRLADVQLDIARTVTRRSSRAPCPLRLDLGRGCRRHSHRGGRNPLSVAMRKSPLVAS